MVLILLHRLKRDFFYSKVCFAIGDGKRVMFWKDSWCSQEPLKVMLTILFALSEAKEVRVA